MMIDRNTASADDLGSIEALRSHDFESVRYREQCEKFMSLRQLNAAPALAGKANGIDDQVAIDVGRYAWDDDSLTQSRNAPHRSDAVRSQRDLGALKFEIVSERSP